MCAFVFVCLRVCERFFLDFDVEDQKVTAVEYAKGWQDPEINTLISHNKAEVGQMALMVFRLIAALLEDAQVIMED